MYEEQVIAVLISLISGLLTIILRYRYERREKKSAQAKTSRKFDELSNLLKTASSGIKEMETEIENKRRRVEELEKLKRELNGLVSLKEEQVTAIRTELNSIMEKSARKNRIWTIIIGAVWFFIGLIVRGLLGF